MQSSTGWEHIRLRIETRNMSSGAESERTISSHVLDTSKGAAAANVAVRLFRLRDGNFTNWEQLHEAQTNADGRVAQLVSAANFESGIYKLQFDVSSYFEQQHVETFYPIIEIVVKCTKGQHYHIPLLLNPFGYSTYRGT